MLESIRLKRKGLVYRWVPDRKEQFIVRSRNAIESVVPKRLELAEAVKRLVNTPVDPVIISLSKKLQDPWAIQKRMVQEQCAHFVFRYLVQNNKQLSNPPRNLLGLAGSLPVMAMASYMRRGLGDHADLFEKDKYIYRCIRHDFIQCSQIWSQITYPFWGGSERKTCTLHREDYLDNPADRKYVGFVLDHCGKPPSPNLLSSFIIKRCPDGIFFLEVTALQRRTVDADSYLDKLQDLLVYLGLRIKAQDSYEYKGGKDNGTNYGSPMKTAIWILEKQGE